MSKLEELIQQYCPEGVEYYHLNDVATIKRGERVTKAQLVPDGQYPVISGGVKPLGYLNRYNREANTITIAQYGTAGYVDWQQNQFWANDVCYSVFSSKIINNRFLYFVLRHNQQLLYSLKTNAIPAIIGKTNRDEIQNQMRLKFARKLQKRNVTEKSRTSYSQKWLSNVN